MTPLAQVQDPERLGVFHADLNLHNILVHAAGMVLLDFDRARLYARPLGVRARRRNLARLRRSLAKLDPAECLAGTEERHAFRAGYGERGSEPCAS